MTLLDTNLPAGLWLTVSVALLAALAFEFVNGFHDTANAVATVIYTRSLRPTSAVVYSGLLNFLGVLVAGVGVAYSVVNLFPIDILLSQQQGDGVVMSMVFAVLLSAIAWNLATWYFGLPASSSQAMIGSIVGASMAYSIHVGLPLEQGVPWDKVRSVIAALLVSPLLGFGCAYLLMLVFRRFIKDRRLYDAPSGDGPPRWIRGLLIASCGGVSFAHGSNDGQKGMGLVMLILVSLLPASFGLNPAARPEQLNLIAARCRQASAIISRYQPTANVESSQAVLTAYLKDQIEPGSALPVLAASLARTAEEIPTSIKSVSAERRSGLRGLYLLEARCLRKWSSQTALSSQDKADLDNCSTSLEDVVQYVTLWVKIVVALALGLGTIVGWKRIVTTVGEKIGGGHLTYAQGLTAQMVAAGTIWLADGLQLPVSTTHVLSSGVAGAACADKAGLQKRTLSSIALAWVLTLPVCITLGMGLFFILLGILT